MFFRFGSALRSGGNTYDNAPAEVRMTLRSNALPVLAEWDPHPFGVMHEHLANIDQPERFVAVVRDAASPVRG